MTNGTNRILMLVTDAYGSFGGISRFNRDFITAVCTYSNNKETVVFPRLIKEKIKEKIEEQLPPGLNYIEQGINGKIDFIKNLFNFIRKDKQFDLIICGHINLLPIAWLASKYLKVPLALIIHGIDAWQPTNSFLSNKLASKVDKLICVSSLTIDRFKGWSGLPEGKEYILPNCVDLSEFSPSEKPQYLLDSLNLQNKTILLTLGRLDSFERKKGFDEVLEALPALMAENEKIHYVIVGDGPDKERLQNKAKSLHVEKHVTFAGMIPEEEKADFYRLADAFVMPSQGEGFGIVLLEAMASGIPAMASKLDGSSEALRHGKLGLLIDPTNPIEVKEGILQTLTKPKKIPEGLDYFSKQSFNQRVHELLAQTLS